MDRKIGSRGPDPMWIKAPLVLRRFPSLFLALFLGGALLAVAASSGPLFISSAQTAALDEAIAGATRFGAGALITASSDYRLPEAIDPSRGATHEVRGRALDARLDDVPHLDGLVATVVGPEVGISADQGNPIEGRLLSRTGALDHIEIVSGDPDGDSDGVWLADLVAEDLDLEVGDEVSLRASGHDGSARVPVDGIYRGLASDPLTSPYWLSLQRQIHAPTPDLPLPPPFVIVRDDVIIETSEELGANAGQIRWEYPLSAGSLTLDEAEQIATAFRSVQSSISDAATPIGRLFTCSECFRRPHTFSSSLTTVMAAAREDVAAIRGPVDLLSSAGTLVAFVVIAAAGVFLVARRGIEIDLLSARGVPTWSVSTRTGLEAVLPLALGLVLGTVAAIALVAQLGPSEELSGRALGGAARSAASSFPIAVLLVAAVTAGATLKRSDVEGRSSGWSGLPWELVPLVGAAYCFQKIAAGDGLAVHPGEEVARPTAVLLLFPILLLAGGGGLMARSAHAASRGIRTPTGPAAYLAQRRMGSARRLAVLLVAACSLSLGMFIFAHTVVQSMTRTVDSKSRLFVGSDVQGTIRLDEEVPQGFPFPVTKVTKIVQEASLGEGGPQVDVLAIDPATFAEVAYWEESFSSTSLERMTASLDRPGGPRIPIVLVNGGDEPDSLFFDTHGFPVEVVAEADYFPGMSLNRPLIVGAFSAMDAAFEQETFPNPFLQVGNSSELWVKGPTGAASEALASSDVFPYAVITAREVREHPTIDAATRTFGFLKSLGIGTALLTVIGLLLYVQARQRNRVVSYALSRRMGLERPSHRLALFLEIAGMLVTAFAIATALGIAAAIAVYGRIDPLPKIAPGPILEIPWFTLGVSFVLLLIGAAVGAFLTDRSAERADFAEVMRLAT